MKKILRITIIFTLIIIGVSFIILKSMIPLSVGAIAYSGDRKVVVVEVGNKMKFGDIQVESILINNDDEPKTTKIQVSNLGKGFTVGDDKENEIIFRDLHAFHLPYNTDPQKRLDRVNEGTATKKEKIYAVTVWDNKEIDKVIVKYRYFCMEYEEEITIN
ncbi:MULTISPECIES: hypothetical protein [Bacillus]|uniref:Uncharacterized protein n=2 Tax=Bacillus cereus group TaxID=86661 RepID=A0A2C1DXV0_BACCE|nr:MULTISPECIES: hypothetical protein [Bacillus cereus group]OFD81304.1 hypothetical protein BWGOE8_17780 [Bacillus mycoides]OFD81547.1 hypothetical protein BWGOE9_17470 [Bacillus mycoides]OFD83838.1 hypothetical protein BWGOE10_17660 [Bacillus mycoides]PGT05266.1 hypothetical protein COD09_05795 [Bacillus cereus]